MPLSVIGGDLAQDFYLRLVPRGAPVLILGAGEGQLACTLGQRGHEVMAVDPSSRLLELAIERREVEAPKAAIRFVNADLRTHRLGRTFPAVLLPRNALGLARSQGELTALLATLSAHLAPDGLFALDARLETRATGGLQPVGVPHLRERLEGRTALHRLELSAMGVEQLDAALREAHLEARERYLDFSGTPWTEGAALQVVVGGHR